MNQPQQAAGLGEMGGAGPFGAELLPEKNGSCWDSILVCHTWSIGDIFEIGQWQVNTWNSEKSEKSTAFLKIFGMKMVQLTETILRPLFGTLVRPSSSHDPCSRRSCWTYLKSLGESWGTSWKVMRTFRQNHGFSWDFFYDFRIWRGFQLDFQDGSSLYCPQCW